MASSNTVPKQLKQQNVPLKCVACRLVFNSVESAAVHNDYHRENLLSKWAAEASAASEENNNNNNNNNSAKNNSKREFNTNTMQNAMVDSSEALKKSPEYSRTSPEGIFGHPPTPQSYHSSTSPYQNNDNFSPNFPYPQQPQPPIKEETHSPNYQSYNYSEPQFFAMDQNQQQQQQQQQQQHQQHQQQYQEFNAPPRNVYRYHPYQPLIPQERQQANPQVSLSSPAYLPQPTPSPSPKQCDKCGYVCDSATQLIEHLNLAHPSTPVSHLTYHQGQYLFGESQEQKTDDTQSEILDLDSHKVHQIYPQEGDKRPNGDLNSHNHPHSVNAMLNTWSPGQQQQLFHQQFMNGPEKFQNLAEQKLFQAHQIHQQQSQEFLGNNVTTSQENGGSLLQQSQQNYRPFESLPPPQPAPVVTSSLSNPPQPTVSPAPKSTNWKSNEARRPKTYNCTACSKWFTSSGHLKRHYNTTLHKNAVKSSGKPDPASLPISTYHHPARESSASREDRSGSPDENSKGDDGGHFERLNPQMLAQPLPNMLQQQPPPTSPYERQPAPNIHQPTLIGGSSTGFGGSPPNGDAGLSASNIDQRGLLALNSPAGGAPHPFNMPPPPAMMPIDNQQFQMYPNESAPHVTQVMDTNSLNITGEYHDMDAGNRDNEPLPSFSNFIGRQGLVVCYGNANVGGGGAATAPYSSTYYDPSMYKPDDEYKLTVLNVADHTIHEEEIILYHLPLITNNNIDKDPLRVATPNEENQINFLNKSPEHTKQDYEERTGSPRISSTVSSTSVKQGMHKCVDCDKLFNKACYLTQHNKTFHSGDKPFKCGRCGKRFSSEVNYQEHTKKHAGEKPHKCERCPKQFNHKTDLRRHMCLHLGTKPYSCETCNKGFIRKDHMLKHQETHFRKHTKVTAIRS